MNILSEGCGHRQGVLGAQDHRAGATGDACGKMGGQKQGKPHPLNQHPRKEDPRPQEELPLQTMRHLSGEARPIRDDAGGRRSQRGGAEGPALQGTTGSGL